MTDSLAWLAHLPQLSTEQAGRKVLSALRSLNGATLPPLQRYQQFSKLNSHVNALISKLEQGCLDAEIPLHDMAATVLIRQLLHESISCHNIIINQLITQGTELQQQELLSLSIGYALRFKSHYLMEHYLSYQPNSSDFWGELKLLYQYARQYKLERIPISDKKGIEQTIESTFISILLFAAINPFRLQRKDIISSYQILNQWAYQCHFSACNDKWHPNGDWIIDLSNDRPPEYLQSRQSTPDTRNLLIINIEKILQQEQENTTDDLDQDLRQQLLERLSHGWESMPPRNYERRSSYQKMELSVGLQNCHQLLIEQEIHCIDKNKNTLWSLHLDNRWLKSEIETHERVLRDIQEIDVSIGGYGLRCPAQHTNKLQKGELVLIRHAGSSNKVWRLGQARWLLAEHDSPGILLGISILAEDATPLIIAASTTEEDSGLLLPASNLDNPFDSPLATLILPRHYRIGDILHCITAHAQVKVQLTQQSEQGPSFKLFSYNVIKPPLNKS